MSVLLVYCPDSKFSLLNKLMDELPMEKLPVHVIVLILHMLYNLDLGQGMVLKHYKLSWSLPVTNKGQTSFSSLTGPSAASILLLWRSGLSCEVSVLPKNCLYRALSCQLSCHFAQGGMTRTPSFSSCLVSACSYQLNWLGNTSLPLVNAICRYHAGLQINFLHA